jgi:type I thyroxine 5'-deiodinase
MAVNQKDGIKVNQPKSYEERVKVAGDCIKDLKLSIPCLVDDMDNSAQKGYAGWPDRIYVIDREGKISYKGDPGPRGFKPADAEDALKEILSGR